MKKIIFTLLLSTFYQVAYNQFISGYVFESSTSQDKKSVAGAMLRWEDTQITTTSDKNGYFELPQTNTTQKLIVSMFGYQTDTIIVENTKKVEIHLKPLSYQMSEIQINAFQNAQIINPNTPIYTKTITTAGLKKLPCCNLSESFENNADVDVNYTDALTGAKQIRLLGLDGKYTQILIENIPYNQKIFGLMHIPGPWMHSIQISKGTASVINGYDAISGQINIELKKPIDKENFFLNLYGNTDGRMELNTNKTFKLGKYLGTTFLLHSSINPMAFDHNEDGFADEPITKQLNFMNRWMYHSANFEFQFGIKVMEENRSGGQMRYLETRNADYFYSINASTSDYQTFVKIGAPLDFIIKDLSVGSTWTYSNNISLLIYGKNKLINDIKSFLGNIIFEQSISEHNKLNFGTTFLNHILAAQIKIKHQKDLNDTISEKTHNLEYFHRFWGFFVQYTYTSEKLSAIFGYRADYVLHQGFLNTFRAHLRYKPVSNITLRASMGNGNYFSSFLMENASFLATNKIFVFNSQQINTMEKAWNFGASVSYDIFEGFRKFGTLTVDFYRTNFYDQIVVDIDSYWDKIIFQQLEGKSYSNSCQVEFSFEPYEKLDVLVAIKYSDVKHTISQQLIEKNFVNKYRGLLTLSYISKNNQWMFDFTSQFVGPSRLPDTKSKPVEYQLPEYSPAYYIGHFQITRKIKSIELYTGIENITNYTQKNAIVAAEAPFSNYFDASIIWGPLMGRKYYIGFRWKI